VALCLGGIYAGFHLPSSVFPQTNFPRVVILVDNGVMPADEMMATVTRPIEEAMKDIPGAIRIRSITGRGSAAISIFFTWGTDMVKAELYVDGRISQIRSTMPSTVSTTTRRLTFSAFPILGVSLTSPRRASTELWEMARYEIKPRFLRIPGVARVDLVGGRTPEYHIIVDPIRLQAANLTLTQVTDALSKNNQISPTGMHEENHTLYLAVVDGLVHNIGEIEEMIVSFANGRPTRVRDFARVERGPEPVFNVVTAEGVPAVLLNVRSQPDGSTIDIANGLKEVMEQLRHELPPDLKMATFYDQSLLVRASVRSVWDAILFGLILSVVIIYLFLKNWGTTLTAIIVIPVTVLITLLAMKLAGLSLNIMTLARIFHKPFRNACFLDGYVHRNGCRGSFFEKFSFGTPLDGKTNTFNFHRARRSLHPFPSDVATALNALGQPVSQAIAANRLRQSAKTSCIGKAVQYCT
jgi:multidrug efflux pump subunit AcrB